MYAKMINWENIAAKTIGVLAGVLLSMVMVAPESTRNAFMRVFFGFIGSFIFTPVTQNLVPWLRGDSFEIIVAAGCATGFVCWFILEFTARLMSARKALDRLFIGMLKMRGIDAEGLEVYLDRDAQGKRRVEYKHRPRETVPHAHSPGHTLDQPTGPESAEGPPDPSRNQ